MRIDPPAAAGGVAVGVVLFHTGCGRMALVLILKQCKARQRNLLLPDELPFPYPFFAWIA
ncbi:MAG: hypothetical protein HPY85_08445 [Anaerolineae bacterium]|nr:hypothetical protein [Anaerolineae bacterium]